MLRKGLTSELFYLAFLMPDSGYALAQRSQNTKKTPSTSKTNPAINKLEKAGYLRREDDEKLHPVSENVVVEIIEYLENEKGIVLEEGEGKILKNMLSENLFFLFVGFDFFQELQNRPKNLHNVDAVKNIADKIGMISALMLESKKKSGEPESTNKKSFEQIQKEIREFMKTTNIEMGNKMIGKKSIKNQHIKSLDLVSQGFKSLLMMGILFDKIPNDTIEKFANLWSQYMGFKFGVHLSNFDIKEYMNSHS